MVGTRTQHYYRKKIISIYLRRINVITMIFFPVLSLLSGVKARALYTLSMCSTTELYLAPFSLFYDGEVKLS